MIKGIFMLQPLQSSRVDLRHFQCANEGRTTIDLSRYTLIRADKTKVGSCCLQLFCFPCLRAGDIRLVVENKQTRKQEIIRIAYDYDNELNADYEKIQQLFNSSVEHVETPS